MDFVKLLDSLVPIDFRSSLRGPLRRFYLSTFISCVGIGLTLSLFVVYLHNVRGFSTSFSTLLLALSAMVGLASAPLWGTLTDRLGPLRVILFAYCANAVALVYWAVAHTRAQAIVGALLLATFSGAGWGPSSTMLSRLVVPELRQRAFGVNFMLVNLGIGFGGLISASVVDLQRPDTFTLLYIFNAVVTIVAALFYLTLRQHGRVLLEHHDNPHTRSQGWRDVLKDRRLVRYVLASVVLMLGGYGSIDAGLSLFVVNNLKLSVHSLGIILFFNTSTIVVAQLWVLNRIEGRSRTRVMGVVAAMWFFFWLIVEFTLSLPPAASIAMLCLGMVIFAIGETILQPAGSAIVNDIAPEHLRGRYNVAAGLAWGISGTLAPAFTALFYSVHLGNWWPFATGLTALLGGVMITNLRRHISASADGRAPLTLG